MVNISSTYENGLRCIAKHGPSGVEIVTDAPLDNHGRGLSFSPTDLLATSLGTCMMTTMAIVAERAGLDLTGSTLHIEKHMAALPVRKVARVVVVIHVPVAIEETMRQRLIAAANACPVHHSVHPDLVIDLTIQWQGD